MLSKDQIQMLHSLASSHCYGKFDPSKTADGSVKIKSSGLKLLATCAQGGPEGEALTKNMLITIAIGLHEPEHTANHNNAIISCSLLDMCYNTSNNTTENPIQNVINAALNQLKNESADAGIKRAISLLISQSSGIHSAPPERPNMTSTRLFKKNTHPSKSPEASILRLRTLLMVLASKDAFLTAHTYVPPAPVMKKK